MVDTANQVEQRVRIVCCVDADISALNVNSSTSFNHATIIAIYNEYSKYISHLPSLSENSNVLSFVNSHRIADSEVMIKL